MVFMSLTGETFLIKWLFFKKIKGTNFKLLIKEIKSPLKPHSAGLCQWGNPGLCCCLLLVDWKHPAIHLAHGYYVQHPDRSWSCHFSFTDGVRTQGESENELFVLQSRAFEGKQVVFCALAEREHENKLPFHFWMWLNILTLWVSRKTGEILH